MTWAEHHRESQHLVAAAETAARQGDRRLARALYADAAAAEESALAAVDDTKTRTLGISAVSATSLRYKAGQYQLAEAAAYKWLARGDLPTFATSQLKELLEAVWNEASRQQAGVQFAPGQVIVSVKGGEVIRGGAPLDLIVEKVQTVKALFHRTAEFLRGEPYRRTGPASAEIQEMFRPWIFQAAPGSYQFAVAVQEPAQGSFLRPDGPTSVDVAGHFLTILRVSAEDPDEGLLAIVQDESYRGTFLTLARNLAPTGRTFDTLEVRASDQPRPITLAASTRRAINEVKRKTRPAQVGTSAASTEDTIHGVLRAVHLDLDWLEVSTGGETLRISEVGEAVDDVIGPMVNRPVVLRIVRGPRGPLFRDIEPDE